MTGTHYTYQVAAWHPERPCYGSILEFESRNEAIDRQREMIALGCKHVDLWRVEVELIFRHDSPEGPSVGG